MRRMIAAIVAIGLAGVPAAASAQTANGASQGCAALAQAGVDAATAQIAAEDQTIQGKRMRCGFCQPVGEYASLLRNGRRPFRNDKLHQTASWKNLPTCVAPARRSSRRRACAA